MFFSKNFWHKVYSNCKLAQSILRHKFFSKYISLANFVMHHFSLYISPSERAFEKYIPWGFFSEFCGIGVETGNRLITNHNVFPCFVNDLIFFCLCLGVTYTKLLLREHFCGPKFYASWIGLVSLRRGSTVDCKWERHWRNQNFCFRHIIQYNCNNALDASDYDLNSDSVACESQLHMVVPCT